MRQIICGPTEADIEFDKQVQKNIKKMSKKEMERRLELVLQKLWCHNGDVELFEAVESLRFKYKELQKKLKDLK